MFDLTGKLKEMSIDFRTGQAQLTLSVNEKQVAMNLFDKLSQEKKLSIKLDKYREKRSLTANSYYWVVLEKIAQSINSTKDLVHESMLQDYGTFDRDEDGNIKDFSSRYFVDPIESKIHCKYRGSSVLNGETWYHYYFIKGSSKYDSKEFSALLNGAIYEATEMGLDVMTPAEAARLRYEG